MRRCNPTAQFARFLPAQEAATAIEYALIAAGIAGALVAIISSLGSSVSAMWTTVSAALS